jgi:hypothetical protein
MEARTPDTMSRYELLHSIVRAQRDALVARDYAAFNALLPRRAAAQEILGATPPPPGARRVIESILAMDREMEALFRGRIQDTRAEMRDLARGRVADLARFRASEVRDAAVTSTARRPRAS